MPDKLGSRTSGFSAQRARCEAKSRALTLRSRGIADLGMLAAQNLQTISSGPPGLQAGPRGSQSSFPSLGYPQISYPQAALQQSAAQQQQQPHQGMYPPPQGPSIKLEGTMPMPAFPSEPPLPCLS